MAKKEIEVGDIVKVQNGEGVSGPFQGTVMKLYENAALIEIDTSIKPNPVTILSLPNKFTVVRIKLLTAIDKNGKELKAKKAAPKKETAEKEEIIDEQE